MTSVSDKVSITIVIATVIIASTIAGFGLYAGGYRNGQIDALSGETIRYEQITLNNGTTGWVRSATPATVYRRSTP